MNSRQLFDSLMERIRVATAWNYLGEVYEWDQQVNCPVAAGRHRGPMSALVAEAAHQSFIDPEVGRLLEAIVTTAGPHEFSPLEQRIISRLHTSYGREAAVPAEFVGQSEAVEVESHDAWEKAKQANDFFIFAPHLQKVIDQTRRLAGYYGADLNDPHSIYDALLENNEPGMTTVEVLSIVAQVRAWLVPFVKRIQAGRMVLKNPVVDGDFPTVAQLELGRKLLTTLGFDFSRGHYGVSMHPFSTTVGPDDDRITTDLNPGNLSSFWSTAHEAGHAMFDQGAPAELDWVTVPCSMGIHESQSRLWETMVCGSRPFWQFFYPELTSRFSCLTMPVEEFYRGLNRVQTSSIRVEADEVTYNLHILILIEMELALLPGRLAIADVPRVFADKQERYLGIRPTIDDAGALQDTHWSEGLFAYYPVYLLGNLGSAQLFAAYARRHPDWEQQFARGDYASLRTWLQEYVYPYGHTMTLNELLIAATGEPLNPQHWFDYIERKYGELYNL